MISQRKFMSFRFACYLAVLLCVYLQTGTRACSSKSSSSGGNKGGDGLSKAKLNGMARKIGGDFGEHLSWLANSSVLFNFSGQGDLALQAYFVPNSEDKLAAQKKGKGANNPIIIYCAGWSETTLKYAKFLRVLNNMGYSIFSFDLRGQGFSSTTGYDKGLVTHVKSFNEYVDDLDLFLNKQVLPKIRQMNGDAGTCTKEEVAKDTCKERELIYVGNSMAALIGMTLQLRRPDVFSKMILISPTLMPQGVNLVTRFAIYFANLFGFGHKLLLRLPRDISETKNTHAPQKAKEWIKFRELASSQLVIQGPSVSFMYELVRAADNMLKMAPVFDTRLLVIQAGQDTFVDNAAMGKFFSAIGGSTARMLRFGTAYHEILIETTEIFSEAIEEISRFLSLKSIKGGERGLKPKSTTMMGYLWSYIY